MYFSSTFGALMEEATLAKRMRSVPAYESDQRMAEGLGHLLTTLEREATQVCDWLRETGDLVEPEPKARNT
jgi:hypothetical protein